MTRREVRRAVGARRADHRHQQSRPEDAGGRSRRRPSGWRRWCRRDRLLVAESGIAEPRRRRAAGAACRRLPGRHRADARAAARPQAARALAFGRVKVCGVTDAADVDAAAARGRRLHRPGHGAGHAARGRRGRGRADRRRGARGGAGIVGVFRNEKMMQVAAAARAARARRGPAARRGGCGLHSRRCAACCPTESRSGRRARSAREVPAPRPGADRTLFDTRSTAAPAAPESPSTGRGCSGRSELGAALLAGGLDPGQCARRRPGRRLGARRRLGRRGRAGPQGSDASSPPSSRRCGRRRAARRCHADGRPLRRLWRRLRAGNPGAGARGSSRPPSSTRSRMRPSRPSLSTLLAKYAGRPTPLTRCRNLGSDRGAHLSEARGSAPRRRAQDQPGARPGAARPADGQDAG